jgi:O-succinylhomoserine sulfhydrylase
VALFEHRLAALERAEALLALGMTLFKSGDHLVCSRSVFGSTTTLFRDYFGKFDIQISSVPPARPEAWAAAIRPNTRLLFCETPSNPLLEIADIRALARIARDAGAHLVIDNTFATPCAQNPIPLGAHLVLHSASKYIDGQGRCIGGALVGRAELIDRVRKFMRCAGPAMTAHTAWLLAKGLETLQIRMERHSLNAQIVASWLQDHPRVRRVLYTGLRSHPQHDLACAQQRLHGGVLSFLMDGGRAAAWRCIDAMRMISRTTNVGDVKSTVTHPATTTHLKLTELDRALAGIEGGLIRLTIGLEDVEDIIADLERGLSAI